MNEQNRIERREFIFSAGMLLIAASLPATVWAAQGEAAVPSQAAGGLADWTIDDMWGVHPRPAQAIGYGRRRATHAVVAAVDAQFG